MAPAQPASHTYIPLTQAAKRYGFSLQALHEFVEAGLIPAGKSPDGEFLVAVQELDPSLKIIRREPGVFSLIWESKPVSASGQANFLNGAAV